MAELSYTGRQFYIDGEKTQIISGAMHYFRIPREYWYDRLLKLKECGFNTVETYVCWNLHEPREGEFDFSGMLDVEEYIRLASQLGLYVIVRPGPYICAEWECGGLPAWLLTYKNMHLRCCDGLYLEKLERYLKELIKRLEKHFSGNGGRIIMLQVENEYGSFGSDTDYLRAVKAIYEKYGAKTLYFTSDGPGYTMLTGGTVPQCLAVANFGSKPKEQLKLLEEFRPDQPLMCGEYWNGWFSQWGCKLSSRPYGEVISDFKDFLEMGASLNMYMFHGGTNFGFTNGANYDDKLNKATFTVTSYDYAAVLTEAGDRTPMYYGLRDALIERYGADKVPPLTAKESEKKAYGKVKLTRSAALFDNLEKIGTRHTSKVPLYMEELGQSFGFILYRAVIEGPKEGARMRIDGLRDRASIFVNGELKGIYDRNVVTERDKMVRIPLGYGESAVLDVLVENMGRINYGPFMADTKGASCIRFGNTQHHGWDIYSLPMDDLKNLEFKDIESYPAMDELVSLPAFYYGELNVEGKPCDTWIRLDGFTKGFVVINGINLGRFWEIGPQRALYLPAPFLKEGKNEIIVYENEGAKSLEVEFVSEPDLGSAKAEE